MAAAAFHRTREWFEDHLYKFFIKHFGQAAYNAEFLDSPRPNQYVFDLPDMNKRVILTCNPDASIDKEERNYKYANELEQSANSAEAYLKRVGMDGYATYFDTAAGIGHPYSKGVQHYASEERAPEERRKLMIKLA